MSPIIGKMLPATEGRLQFSTHRVQRLAAPDAKSCAQACADDRACGGMAVGPAASGAVECRLAVKKVARNAALLPSAGWTSATKAERPDRAGASREKFVFRDGTSPIGGYDVPQGTKTTDEALADCTAACSKEGGCRALSVRVPGSGLGRCDLWDAAALAGLTRESDPDGEYAGAVVEPSAPGTTEASERATFGAGVKAMRTKTIAPGRDAVADCVAECEGTEFCRVATVFAPRAGRAKCGLWNGAAMKSMKREPDSSGRYAVKVLPEKDTVASSGPGFEPLRQTALKDGADVGAMLAACRKECLASKKTCGVIAVNRTDELKGTCYLGAPQPLKEREGPADPRWTREVVVNPEDAAAPPPLVPAVEHYTSATRVAAEKAPPAPDGWFSGTIFDAPDAAAKNYARYTGSVESPSSAVGASAYPIPPAEFMPLQHEIVRKGVLSGPQSVLLTIGLLLAVILFMWMFIFFLQSNGVTLERVTGAYRSAKEIVMAPESRRGLSHAAAAVRGRLL